MHGSCERTVEWYIEYWSSVTARKLLVVPLYIYTYSLLKLQFLWYAYYRLGKSNLLEQNSNVLKLTSLIFIIVNIWNQNMFSWVPIVKGTQEWDLRPPSFILYKI